MGQSGSAWVSVDQCGIFWVSVYGLIWLDLGHCGSAWVSVDQIGQSQCGSVWVSVDQCG